MTGHPHRSPPRTVSARLAGVLLAAAVAGVAGTLIGGWGWWSARRSPAIEELSPEARQELVQELVDRSPGVYRWAYFEPRIGYTLVPGAEHAAWGDRFVANELGYRTGPPAKVPGTFRIVFVGDSWTYGMGIKETETFAEVVEELANRFAGLEQPVESWILGLPSYNTLNEVAALDFFFDTLEPDAVVLCPAGNDNNSTLAVLPNGSTVGRVATLDDFGDPHYVAYEGRRIDSYRYRERWRAGFDAVRGAELRLRRRGVPLLLNFIARWRPPEAHAMVAGSGIEAPYVVVPVELTHGRWRTKPWGHGTAEANRVYGEIVYRGLAELLGWPELPADERHREAQTEVFEAPPPGTDWVAEYGRSCAATTAEYIPEDFRPGRKSSRLQAVGDLDPRSGLLGRAATVLVRRRSGSGAVTITVRRLDEGAHLYPLGLELAIPSPAGGSRVRVVVAAEGPATQRFELPIPADLRSGVALDVVLVTERSVSAPHELAPRSLYVDAIDNLDRVH